jgi:hypothetical protein
VVHDGPSYVPLNCYSLASLDFECLVTVAKLISREACPVILVEDLDGAHLK